MSMLACCHGDAAPLLPTTPRNIKHHQPSPCFYARGLVRAFIGKHFSGCFRGAICSFSLRFYFILWWYVESWIDCRCAGGKCAFFRFQTEICVLMRYICRGPELGSGCGLRFAPSRSRMRIASHLWHLQIPRVCLQPQDHSASFVNFFLLCDWILFVSAP